MRQTLILLALFGCLACGAWLAVRRGMQWSAAHPVLAGVLLLVALPVLAVFVRAMPRPGALRRAARAGMADAAAAECVPAASPAAGPAEGRDGALRGATVELPRDGAADAEAVGAVDFECLDADAFEEAIAGLCERDGCRDVTVVGGAGDLGADVVATTPDGRRLVIQCKRYCATNKVGSQDLQRFGGTCYTVHEADVAAVVTTSTFTEPAAEYAGTCGILCVDAALLAAWSDGSGTAPWH
ncbi:restriction endonuclease [Streptomyces sp. NPDC001922]|uniref:restriction endonuclease n=1 Tax=Streptomyces sp. NPDC001922 TaxID=3364624 RepID=UPI0036D161BF